VAVNLVLRPTLDDILLRQVGEAARTNGDGLTWLLLANLDLDAARCRRWSVALTRYALVQREGNAEVLQRWVDRWTPRAETAAEGLAALLAAVPETGRPGEETVAQARQARERLLAETGL
jgi:toluene monooxygenase system protein E